MLAGTALLDGATRQKYQHTSSSGYEHLCDSMATVTTDTDVTLHSTQRKRSRFIITLNKQYLLSFAIAYSNSKNTGLSCEFAPTQAHVNSLFKTIYFSITSVILYSALSMHCQSRPRPSGVGCQKTWSTADRVRKLAVTMCSPCFRWTHRHSQFWTFPTQVPTELPRTVFPTRSQQVDLLTNFVLEELLDLSCWTMISAFGVVRNISKHLDIVTLEILSNFGATSILTWV